MTASTGVALRELPFHGTDLVAAVSTRRGGISTGVYASLNLGDHVGDDHGAVLENRQRLCQALGIERLTVADQQHGSTVALIDSALAGRGHSGDADARAALPATDAMVTSVPGVALAVIVGDCAPVVLYDPVARAVGVAHCGRRGIVAGLLPKTLATMTQHFGTHASDVLVGIGPCIAAASYEIGLSEAAAVETAFPSGVLLTPTRPGHVTFDMVGAMRCQLAAAGVTSAHLSVMDIDTRASTDDFFSDRAARPCGRFMAVVALR